MITDTPSILNKIKTFYSNLYSKTSEPPHLHSDTLMNIDMPKLTEENKTMLESCITEQELFKSLKTFGKNKSPGNDGLSAEFYIFFWDSLKGLFMKAVQESFDKGELSTSHKQGIIPLLEKLGKDQCFIQNWRPITLLNIDRKMISKCLALRLRQIDLDE